MDPATIDALVCPVTHSKLRLEGDFLIATVGGLKYPIKDGIPALIPSLAILPEGVASLEEFKQKFAKPRRN